MLMVTSLYQIYCPIKNSFSLDQNDLSVAEILNSFLSLTTSMTPLGCDKHIRQTFQIFS